MTVRTRVIRRTGVGLVAITLAALAGHAGARADARFTKAYSDAFQQKVNTIEQIGKLLSRGGASTAVKSVRQTPISESELNSYLRFELRDQVPAGVAEPTVTILGDGRLIGTAIVDLDAVRQARQSNSWFDPVRLLSGRVPVTASGLLQTQQGTGRFTLESAEISGVPVPKTVLQQVVGYYTRTPENADGVNLDDAFELPARIREIRVQPGQAIVVQ
jgi:hypothetical protein